MSFLNQWFNNNLSNNVNILNTLSQSELKWIPDNNLTLQYNKYLNNCAELNRLRYSLESILIPKSKQLIKEFMKKSRSSVLDERNQVQHIRKEMSHVQTQISKTEISIKELENYDLDIVEKWEKYLEKAGDFLEHNDINSEIITEDILSDDRLYIMCKKICAKYNSNVESNKYLKLIRDITQFFDVNYSVDDEEITDCVEYKKKLDEFLNFETKNSLDAVKKAPTLFLRDVDNNLISYELNINNEPIELSDDIIAVLYGEYNIELFD